MVMSPQAASDLDGDSASRHKNEAQTQYLLHHSCLLGVPMVGRNQYGYITPGFLWSPWWGEINLVRSECGGNKQKNGRKLVKLGENRNIPYPNVKEASKYPLSNNNDVHSITKYGVLGRLDVQIVALRAHCAWCTP